MDYETIELEITDKVAVIRLNRPEVKNALNTQMRAEITQCVNQMGKEARVLVITGSGSAFCSGQDLGDRKSVSQIDLERTLRDEYEPMLRSILDCPVPTIAAINGAAAGAGANLALAADVVIACESAYFLQAFTRIGLIPDAGGTYIMPRTMGKAKAMGASLFADKITANQADRWGLIWEAVPDEDFEKIWLSRANHLADGPTVAYGYLKEALKSSFENDLNSQLSLEAKLQNDCGNTRDFQEGVLAFFTEKRSQIRRKITLIDFQCHYNLLELPPNTIV
jgi:2-(1,2-epoxy-1,2-dihydrophenyl)acetyl-CoA isomerase